MLLKEGRFGESLWEGQREGGANSSISPNVNEVPTTNGGLRGDERDGRSCSKFSLIGSPLPTRKDFVNRGSESSRMIFWAFLLIVPAGAASPPSVGEF